jgi:uncharacterized membrane protein YkoI
MTGNSKLVALAGALAATAAIAVAAQSAPEDDALAIGQAQITLSQAIAAAEQQHPGGKALRAEFERTKSNGWVYDVEIVSGPKVFDVRIDAKTGALIASTEDKADHDDNDDERE